MNKRTILSALLCMLFAHPNLCLGNVNLEKQTPGETKKKPKIEIILVAPDMDRPPPNPKPTFKWKLKSDKRLGLEDIKFSFKLWKVQKMTSGKIGEGPVVFELNRKKIPKMSLRFPDKLLPLNQKEIYAWKVKAYKNNRVIAVSSIDFLFWNVCQLIPYPSTYNICEGSPIPLRALIFMFGNSISGPIDWHLIGPGVNASGTNPGVLWTHPSTPGPPLDLGVHQAAYTLTVTRGTCSRSCQFTVNVYPNLTAEVEDPVINAGEDNRVRMLGIPASLDNYVTWTWQDSLDNGVIFSLPQNLGVGNNWKNTGIISPNGCPNPPCGFVLRRYTAAVDLSSLDLTGPPPDDCPNPTSVDVKVCCPNNGNITAASSTHSFSNPPANTQICSGNPPNYPVLVTLEITGYNWTDITWHVTPNAQIVSSSSPDVATYSIESADEYTFTADITNGECGTVQRSVTILVVDPVEASVAALGNVEWVCPHDDAVMELTPSDPPLPPGTIINWYYQINCTGSWIPAGAGTGVTEFNTNGIGPLHEDWKSVCWKAEVQDQYGVCDPFTTNVWQIDVSDPPCKPVLSGPPTKCPGESVDIELALTDNPQPCSDCVGYRWFLDGNLIDTPTNSGSQYSVTEPGNYVVEAFINCTDPVLDCPEFISVSDPLTIKDCIITIKLYPAVCCSDGHTPITITATALSTCGGPYSYQWTGTDGFSANTAQITLDPPPQITTGYTVTVTDGSGCQAEKTITITACH